MHFRSWLRSAEAIINSYDGAMPFAAWLKQYFSKEKKFGSKDRKWIADLCFCYYRLGNLFSNNSVEEKLVIAQFLCHGESQLITELKPEWQHAMAKSPSEKLAFLEVADPTLIYPFNEHLSPEIDPEKFSLSFLAQPDLFLRIRPGREEKMLNTLSTAGIYFRKEESTLRLSNASKIDEIIQLNCDAVVQDKSSQQVFDALVHHADVKKPVKVWDCCAASGGKSILISDLFANIQLTVSDIRESIIINLKKRFKDAGIVNYSSLVMDVAAAGFSFNKKFDIIICDVPCSGSGTWARTPEQLSFFREDQVSHYTNLQQRITFNAARQLNKGGYLVYITCSVFKEENEKMVKLIEEQTALRCLQSGYLKGYEGKADTLFSALFTI